MKNFIFVKDLYSYDIHNGFVANTNIMGLVAVSTVVGVALSILQSELAHFTSLIKDIYNLTMKLTNWAIALSPIGIFFLVVTHIIEMDDLKEVGRKLGFYFLTVLLGCLIQGIIVLPTLYFVFTRLNPFRFIRGLSQALVTAFGTSSRLRI